MLSSTKPMCLVSAVLLNSKTMHNMSLLKITIIMLTATMAAIVAYLCAVPVAASYGSVHLLITILTIGMIPWATVAIIIAICKDKEDL